MPADLVIKAGNTQPTLTRALQYSDLSPVDLNGKTVSFQMRSMTSAIPVTLTGTLTVVNEALGIVSYAFSSGAPQPGSYLATFDVTAGSDTMSFPTDGYLSIEVEQSVAGDGTLQLVSLQQVKSYPGISIPAGDRSLDARLVGFIEAARPLIEQVTGPIIPTIYNEKYDGGNNIISLRHRPSTGYGTSPILNLLGVSEFRGPIEYPLSIVANPVFGSIYSVEVDVELGTLTRRSAGGGTVAFQPGRNSIHVVYQAGQASIPFNVQEATLELIRLNYQTTMAVGTGRRTQADPDGTGPPLGFFMHRRALELLGATRRFPSIA